jgi:hypothetical protein
MVAAEMPSVTDDVFQVAEQCGGCFDVLGRLGVLRGEEPRPRGDDCRALLG